MKVNFIHFNLKLFIMNIHRTVVIIAHLLVSLICFTSCQPPNPPRLTESDNEYIRNMTANVQDSWNRGDREPYANRFSKEAFYMAPNMETLIGRDTIRSFAKTFPDLKIKFSIVEILGSSESAYVRGIYVSNSPEGKMLDKGKFMSIWQKNTEGQWQLTHDIFNSDMPAPVMQKESAAK